MIAEPNGRIPPQRGAFSLRAVLAVTFTALALISSLALAAVMYRLSSGIARESIRARLHTAVAVGALQIDPQLHAGLLQPSDEDSPAYASIRTQLRSIRGAIVDARFVYTVRREGNPDDGWTYRFIVDAEEDGPDFSPLGSTLELQAARDTLDQAFEHGGRVTVNSEFVTDHWGTWLSGYAPLRLPDGTVDAVLGVDLSAASVTAQERRFVLPVLVTCLISGLTGVGAGIILARFVSKPLRRVSTEMGRIQNLDIEGEPFPVNPWIAELATMSHALNGMKTSLQSFRRYVPAQLVRTLISSGQAARSGGRKQTLTVFFSDIAHFTDIAETLPAEELVRYLNAYLTRLNAVILEHEGTVDKFIGDAVMAFWGAPVPVDNAALKACLAALDCQSAIDSLHRQWEQEGLGIRFPTRIGLHTGDLVVGNVGSEDRLNYTVIGDTVNLASRLEGANSLYGTPILLSDSTRLAAGPEIETCLLDLIRVKGRQTPVSVHTLLGRRSQVGPETLRLREIYERAFNHYLEREFPSAVRLLEGLPPTAAPGPLAAPAALLLQRCRACLDHPPAPDWDGVFSAVK